MLEHLTLLLAKHALHTFGTSFRPLNVVAIGLTAQHVDYSVGSQRILSTTTDKVPISFDGYWYC